MYKRQARNGIVVGSGITLSKDGDVFFTGIATGNGSGLTALNASNLASGTVPTARLGSGTASSSTFLRGDSTFAAVTSTTINNNGDNKVITGSGTADTLNAEGNVYIDAQGDLGLGISDITPTAASYNGATLQLHQTTTGSYGSQIKMTTASGGYGSGDGFYIAHWGGNNSTYIYNKEDAPIYFGTNATERATIDEHLTISDGNLVIGTSGHGIDFSAAGNASGMTSELLDDYEEGTFTPTCVSGGFGNWSANVGRYTKIGRLVNISWEEGFNSSGDGSTLIIGGLPYIADDWTPGSMYAGSYSDESSQMATPAVPASTATIKVITWGAEATGNKFGTSTYSAWNITYTTSQ